MIRLLKTRSQKSGLPPGTPFYVGDKKVEEVKITLIDYTRDTFERIYPKSIKECLSYKDKPTVTWLNIDGLHKTDIIEEVGAGFGLHPLTVEDILNTTQRPKIDIYDDYVFLVVKMHIADADSIEIRMEQVSFVLGRNFLLTFQETAGDTFEAVRNRLAHNKGRIRKMGEDYLAYALIDSIVDNYFAVLENVGEGIENLEEELIAKPTPDTLQTIHFLKREMLFLRKSIWPLREVISGLQRQETPLISESINFFLKDLYDHTIQIIDTIETFRDMLTGMIDIYLSSISNRMNEIMKVLTVFAAIFIPLTFIAGVYGMNFNTARSPFNMPELNWFYGYPFAVALMIVTGLLLVFYFKRNKWF